MRPPIPKESADAWEALQGDLKQKKKIPLNPGLVFERFIDDWSQTSDKDAKRNALKPVLEAADHTDTDLLSAWKARWHATAEADHARYLSLQTDWRLVSGLGRKGPLEVGFTFHRYGFPFLPGSSVKGIARAYAFFQVADALGGLEKNKLEKLDKALSEDDGKEFVQAWSAFNPPGAASQLAQEFRQAFGTTGKAGQAVFLDALPENPPKLDPDIMNPHYPKYYQGGEAPTDWQNPNPILFLTVAPGQKFCFAVGWRGLPDTELQMKTLGWLEVGLKELGAGGKTSAGYGYFLTEKEAAPLPAPIKTMPTVAPAAAPQALPSQPVQTRSGTILEIRPDKHVGKLRDSETGQEYTFSTRVILGNTPAKRDRVTYDLQGDTVVRVKR